MSGDIINNFGGPSEEAVANIEAAIVAAHVKLDYLISLITNQGARMSELTDALDALDEKVTTDANHWRDLLDQALATNVEDEATIADLRAQADAMQADTAAAITRIRAIDPDPTFPAAPPVEPPVDPNVNPDTPDRDPSMGQPADPAPLTPDQPAEG